jgi:hypothetical protein
LNFRFTYFRSTFLRTSFISAVLAFLENKKTSFFGLHIY